MTLFPSSTVFPAASGSATNGLVVVANGLLLNGADGFGATWSTHVDQFAGWDGGSGSSIELTQKTRAPGAWTGPRNLTARTISVGGLVTAPDADGLQDAIDRLTAAITLDDFLFTVTRGTRTRSVIAARQGEPMAQEETDVTARWSVQIVAADPRKFAAAVSKATHLPSVTGGVTVPLVVPLVITSTTVSGAVSLTNPGTATGPVVVSIKGPCTGPIITHVGSGLQLTFGSSLVLASNETLVVDMEAQTALVNGQASRNNTIVSRGWSGFEPGANTWRVDSASYNSTANFTITATPAWA